MKSEQELMAYAAEHIDIEELEKRRKYQRQRLASPREGWFAGGHCLWMVGLFGGFVASCETFAYGHGWLIFSLILSMAGLGWAPIVVYTYFANKRMERIELPPAQLELTTMLVTNDHYMSLQTMAREGDVEVLLDEVMVTEDDMTAQAARAHVRDQAAIDSLIQWRQGDLILPPANQALLPTSEALSIDRTVTDAILQLDNSAKYEPSKA